jgi:hypothetical protein
MKACVKEHLLALLSIMLALFACVAAFTQIFDDKAVSHYGSISLTQFAARIEQLGAITNFIQFQMANSALDGECWKLDLALPPDARIYVEGILGRTYAARIINVHYLTYYLFPRVVAVSLDEPTRQPPDTWVGREAQSLEELRTNGFDVLLATGGNIVRMHPLRDDLQLRPLEGPKWFPSRRDRWIAGLLPLLTALSGMSVLRLLLPALETRLSLLEKLACGLGLGMMAATALSLAVKLCGAHARWLVLLVTAVGSGLTLKRIARAVPAEIGGWFRQTFSSPAGLVMVLLFYLVFKAAGIMGLVETDAVAAWMLKAKIFHLYSGHELINWLRQPRLAHVHAFYPPLVPLLHTATFDSLGRVDECVTKYWPAWMSLLLVSALASWSCRKGPPRPGPAFLLLGLVLLPAYRLYVDSEGGTMPMIFFTTLGLVECGLATTEKDRARLALGLTMLVGGAMAKNEGFVVLALAVFWLLLIPSVRPALKPSVRLWGVLAFWFLALLPFLCLRVQIPARIYEAGWAHLALTHPGRTLWNIPPILLMLTARWFVSSDLATWSSEGGRFHWSGHWEGWSTLYHHSTLGLSWVAVLMTVAVWLIKPAQRKALAWVLGVIASVLIAFSGVFASFVGLMSLTEVMDYFTQEITSGRYLFPLLVAWCGALVTLLYRDEAPAPLPAQALGAAVTRPLAVCQD